MKLAAYKGNGVESIGVFKNTLSQKPADFYKHLA